MPIPADAADGLESENTQLFAGNMMVPIDLFNGPQSSAVEAVDALCRGFCKGPRFSPIKENRDDRGIVNVELCLPQYQVVVPEGLPPGTW